MGGCWSQADHTRRGHGEDRPNMQADWPRASTVHTSMGSSSTRSSSSTCSATGTAVRGPQQQVHPAHPPKIKQTTKTTRKNRPTLTLTTITLLPFTPTTVAPH